MRFTPCHALIGPNDSGKSTVLRAVRVLGQLAGDGFEMSGEVSAEGWRPFHPALPGGQTVPKTAVAFPIELSATRGKGTFGVTMDREDSLSLWHQIGNDRSQEGAGVLWAVWARHRDAWPATAGLRGVRLVRFDPDALRAPSGLIPEGETIRFLDERGRGLPGVYQAIQARGDDAFQRITEDVARLFSTVKNVRVPAVSRSELALEVQLVDGTKIRTHELSEGLLYYLAFATIPYLAPTSILLVEEPENGLHPSRIADVIKMLREFSETTSTQVIMATHSPLVVNEMKAEEVTVLTRPRVSEGTRVTPLAETKNFESVLACMRPVSFGSAMRTGRSSKSWLAIRDEESVFGWGGAH